MKKLLIVGLLLSFVSCEDKNITNKYITNEAPDTTITGVDPISSDDDSQPQDEPTDEPVKELPVFKFVEKLNIPAYVTSFYWYQQSGASMTKKCRLRLKSSNFDSIVDKDTSVEISEFSLEVGTNSNYNNNLGDYHYGLNGEDKFNIRFANHSQFDSMSCELINAARFFKNQKDKLSVFKEILKYDKVRFNNETLIEDYYQ